MQYNPTEAYNQAMATRITELEAEVKRLKNRIRELEPKVEYRNPYDTGFSRDSIEHAKKHGI
jgi:cell division protein FtsB